MVFLLAFFLHFYEFTVIIIIVIIIIIIIISEMETKRDQPPCCNQGLSEKNHSL